MVASRLALLLACSPLVAACSTPEGPWHPTPKAAAALRLPANSDEGRRIYSATCERCHGAEGNGDNAGLVPRIAGQHYSVIIRQLADFQAERRHDPRMQQAVADHRLRTPQSLADIATYVNLLHGTPPVSLGGAPSGDLGTRLYELNCSACHGAAAQGSDPDAVPRLADQNRDYLIRQFRDIAATLRPASGRLHAERLMPMQYQEREALADYLSRLR